jgi:thiol-disulfide isomerase/thioredoxin
VDVEENPYLAKAEGVSFVPTFKIYKNGFKVKDIVGPTHQALESIVYLNICQIKLERITTAQ